MSKRIISARKIFKEEFEKSEGFRMGYQANIAMLLHDRYGITDYKTRNAAANDIMAVIFDAKDFGKIKSLSPVDPINSRFEILDL